MAQTLLADLINPQVMAQMISAQLPNAIRFAPLARMDDTLVARAGNTVTVPKYEYIGDAVDVAEGQPIDLTKMETTTQQATIKKAGKGVEITDEAVLSGLGDPIGEAERQLRMAIANKVDNDALAALATTTFDTTPAAMDIAAIEDAQALFNDEDDSSMVLLVHPLDAAKLRKEAAGDWVRASELGDAMLVKGTFGELLGAQVVRSRKLAEGTAYLVKEGALAIYRKRDVDVEDDRDIVTKTTVITADQHYGVVLEDESKAVKIVVTP